MRRETILRPGWFGLGLLLGVFLGMAAAEVLSGWVIEGYRQAARRAIAIAYRNQELAEECAAQEWRRYEVRR